MPTININKAARDALRSESRNYALKGTVVPRGDGTFDFTMVADTFERLENLRLSGESHSDVLIRYVAFNQSSGRRN